MNIALLFIPILMWSFVGIMVKYSSTMVSSGVISFSRFFFGVIFLGVYMLIKKQSFKFLLNEKWIYWGALGKSLNYLFENVAIMMGYSYGYVITGPIQSLFLIFVSIYFFKEELFLKKIIAVILCFIGVILLSWNGMSPSVLISTNLIPTLLFIFSAIGSGIHVISQKVLIDKMDSGNMNFWVFLVSTLITAMPLPFSFKFTGAVTTAAVVSLLGLGFITGISFYIYSNILKKVHFLTAVILGNSASLFALLWAWVFFKEPITTYIMAGSIAFILGMIILNLPGRSIWGTFRHVER